MRILNIGYDKTLVGGTGLGDAVQRHRAYGEMIDSLDIIVYANRQENLKKFQISPKVIGYPSNSLGKMFFIFDAIKIFKKINQQHKIDLLVCQDPFVAGLIGCWLKKFYGCKLQINFHGDFLANPEWRRERWLNYLFLAFAYFTTRYADLLRVVNSSLRDKLIAQGLPAEKVVVLPTPVDLSKFEQFNPSTVAKIQAEQGRKKIILFVGRLVKAKGLPTLLKALKIVKQQYPNFVCLFLGTGEEYNSLLEQRENLGLEEEVKIGGAIKHDELGNYYQACDLFVLPSTNESFGKVLLEAAMAKKPVVATATAGAKEIITDGETGIIVPIGAVETLAQEIINILSNKELAEKLGEANYLRVVSRYNWDDSLRLMLAAWQKCVNKNYEK